jgi:ferrochelatase
MVHRRNKTAAMLLAMGGPDSLQAIPDYLYNIFSDRELIRLPGGALMQKPFARLISRLRAGKVKKHYELIGGSSPLLKWTRAQAANVERELSDFDDFSCYVAMRYYHPGIADSVAKIQNDGYAHVIVIPMYPQFSIATTGSGFRELARRLKGRDGFTCDLVKDFHRDPDYIALLREYIDRHTEPDDILLFTAHSLPQRFVDEGDPYVDQVRTSSELVANGREYYVSFQSRTGPVKWVGPDTVDETRRLLETTDRRICLVPIAFVCDHIETLYELDIELPGLFDQPARDRLYRLPMFNDDPAFGRVLARIVRERIAGRVSA